jgi:hypothetical protein
MGGEKSAYLWIGGPLGLVLALGGCGWLGLIAGALATPTSGDDASTNVAISAGVAYVAHSVGGVERIDLATNTRTRFAPPAPADRIDDVAIADGFLFALDATPPGYLVVYRIAPDDSLLAASVTPVPVGPFSGVAAGGGHVIVSGGTSELTLRRYGTDGMLGPAALDDFGRGQPDIALSPDGRVALVSTHVQGPRFGLTVADVDDAPLHLRSRGYVELPGSGFTEGGFHPANFALQAAALGDYVLVAHGGGLSVLEAAAGEAPTLVGTMPLPISATAIAVDARRRLAFVAGASPEPAILTLDLADVGAPRLVDRRALPATSSPSAIALDDTHLVVALQGGGVSIQARSAPLPPPSTPETAP